MFPSGKYRKICMSLHVSGEMMKQVTKECLQLIKTILLIGEINMEESLQEISLFKIDLD
uniref:Uncharacterized protein n=1 Tax=Rhinolophus ferrumequinum TaxID=59479 RepID=A0A671EHV6_RHIFE